MYIAFRSDIFIIYCESVSCCGHVLETGAYKKASKILSSTFCYTMFYQLDKRIECSPRRGIAKVFILSKLSLRSY